MILLDADVILDVAIDREPHAEASAALLHHLERRPFGAFVAWHTLSNLDYLLRPAPGQTTPGPSSGRSPSSCTWRPPTPRRSASPCPFP